MTTNQIAEKMIELVKKEKMESQTAYKSMNHWAVLNELADLVSTNATELCTAYLKLEKQLEVCKGQRNKSIRNEIDSASGQSLTIGANDQELEKVEG
jgi:hypothetical protein